MAQHQDPTPTPDEVRDEPALTVGAGRHDEVPAGGHGTSVAAWVATGGVSLGALVVCVSMIFVWVPFIVVGAVIIVLAALSAPVLARAGYGAAHPETEYTGGPRAVR